MTANAKDEAWWTLPARECLGAILASASKIWKNCFISKSKKTGGKAIDFEPNDAKLREAKAKLKTTIMAMFADYSHQNETVSADEQHLIDNVEKFNEKTTEDVAGAVGNLAAKFLARQRNSHFHEWVY